ncbi:deoxyuridine 5'-triphosphate nucleotidohydrolase Dut [Candidatus Phycorickettsia trachydisci]|uniref:Deoxyuridine 5'-triphosphate nucleotidohydrolase n=1 Tax=Candidatus Phycorickettsia trachydisci TaxID=2115978 RepID=A0A2P1P704_9RICK|nr:dUTP diphosphatase [Candidatus Phycorickettsia trachydisci]AVP87048.1 deoxyuridine 5'-triphosphate nucleotidohydrolase Dut [Candidatus Phycorickettsia trachydisci]
MKLPVKILDHAKNLPLPSYASAQSAGMDLYAAISEDIILKPMTRNMVPTGICIALPKGYEGQVRSRSGLAAKHGIMVLNSPGTIDADYRGEIKVILMNLGHEEFVIQPGMRIAQLIIAGYTQASWEKVDELSDTERQAGGFGSSGFF